MKNSAIILFLIANFLSADDIKVNVLGKHLLREFEIKIEENARVFSDEKDRTLEKGIYKVKIEKEELVFFNDEIFLQSRQILFRSNNQFDIIFSDNKNNLKRTYKGELELHYEKENILLILKIPLEEYVISATYSELGILLTDKFTTNDAKRELITTQEIVIRTYVLNEKNRHTDTKFHFCDLTHCMSFKNHVNKFPSKPKMIIKGDSPISGYFHSTCGGILTGPEVFWQKHSLSNHYKRGNDGLIPNCKESPQFSWETILTNAELEKILNEKQIISITAIEQDGRIKSLKYTNEINSNNEISISSFLSRTGKLLGWNKIRSNFFAITKLQNGFHFKGLGFGHGIGLCQWGAKYLADNGKSHEEILQFYFPDTILGE
ncbi:MAG: SpoIID/LytB domain-containing protein [Leptospiraceae bacterium]|nr:SpoIID/LytB domain-containing protein [Leptospiraceae bacterium]